MSRPLFILCVNFFLISTSLTVLNLYLSLSKALTFLHFTAFCSLAYYIDHKNYYLCSKTSLHLLRLLTLSIYQHSSNLSVQCFFNFKPLQAFVFFTTFHISFLLVHVRTVFASARSYEEPWMFKVLETFSTFHRRCPVLSLTFRSPWHFILLYNYNSLCSYLYNLDVYQGLDVLPFTALFYNSLFILYSHQQL